MSNFYRHPGRAGGFPVLVKSQLLYQLSYTPKINPVELW